MVSRTKTIICFMIQPYATVYDCQSGRPCYPSIMLYLKVAWAWIKKWWGLIVGVVGLIAGAVIAATVYRSKTGGLRAGLEVTKAKQDIAVLRARREALMEQDDRDEAEVTAIDIDLEENRWTIEAVRKAAGTPDNELAAELARLGF